MVAASVIKIPILIEAFAQMEEGRVKKDELFAISSADKMPSCGALSYMHDRLSVTLEDLYTLMIILSDNTATNLLLKRLGMEEVNARMRSLGLENTVVRRRLFDAESARRGLENSITARDMGRLLEKLYWGKVVSPAASHEMLNILKKQRLNGKIPFFFSSATPIAHKTGEDTGITHDVGIIYTQQPCIVCFCSNGVDVPSFERFIQDTSWQLAQMQSESGDGKTCVP